MKIMTLPKVVKTIKKVDAETAVNESMLTDLIMCCIVFLVQM